MEYLAYRVAVAVVVSPVGVLFLWSLALHTVHSKDLLVCHDLWSDMYGQACVVVRAPFFLFCPLAGYKSTNQVS